MSIDLKSMSDADIAQLLAAAAAELSARLVSRPVVVADAATAPTFAAKPVVGAHLESPDEADRDFALRIATKLRRGEYIKALERERVAEIAQKFPGWARAQRLPDKPNAGIWKYWREYYSVAPAPERR